MICSDCNFVNGHHSNCPSAESGEVSLYEYRRATQFAATPEHLHELTNWPLIHCVHTYRAVMIDPLKVFSVDQHGDLIWLERHEYSTVDFDWNRRNAGKDAGYIRNNGKLTVQHCGRQRVVTNWLKQFGHEREAGYVEVRERNTAGNHAGNTEGMAQGGDHSPEHGRQ